MMSEVLVTISKLHNKNNTKDKNDGNNQGHKTHQSHSEGGDLSTMAKDSALFDNEEFCWDDDEFELPELPLTKEERLTMTTCPAGTKAYNKKSSGEENKNVAFDENGRGDDEDWLAPLCRSTNDKYREPMMTATARKSQKTDEGVYLTDQFARLNTPVSRKKSRCVICTRPIPDGTDGGRFCPKHATTMVCAN